MKKAYLFFIHFFLILGLVATTGCSDADFPDIPEPEEPVIVDPDPEEIITAIILEGNGITIPNVGYISWTKPNNFSIMHSEEEGLASMCNLGKLTGLEDISIISQTGYSAPEKANTEITCELGHGYIVKFEGGSLITPLFVRLYVDDVITHIANGITGAIVKYQQPFATTTLSVSEARLSFSQENETQTIKIATNAVDWSFTCSKPWISMIRSGDELAVSVTSNTGILRNGIIAITVNEKRLEIPVEQGMATTSAPYAIGDIYYENGAMGVVFSVKEGGEHGLIVSVTETKCAWSTEFESVFTNESSSDGIGNMNKIKEIAGWEIKYPAFKWCDDFNSGNVSGWYLPAVEELNDLFIYNSRVNSRLGRYEGTKLLSIYSYHWSSTEYDKRRAVRMVFNSGLRTELEKERTSVVRAIRAF